MNNYFPKLCPPSCGLEINFKRIRNNPLITVYTETILKSITGVPGNFSIILERAPRYIMDNCTACGKCTEVCPVTRPDQFNFGFTESKAVYLPHDMAFPMKYHIDEKFCRMTECALCLEACTYNAINLEALPEEIMINVSSLIVASGWKSYDPAKIKELNYTKSKNIVSNLQFERLLASAESEKGKLRRPSDKKEVKNVVFVQCAGSRDEKHLPYCSAVCCSASLKHAMVLRDAVPDSHVTICYIDLRVSGRNEDFLAKVEKDEKIKLVKGKVAEIEINHESDDLIVLAEDIISGQKKRYDADLVVLATGIVPEDLPSGISKDNYGFYPFGSENPGIYFCSCTRMPMDVASSVKDATAAALKALQIH